MINKKVLLSKIGLCIMITSNLMLSGCGNKNELKIPSTKNPIMELVCVEDTEDGSKFVSYDFCETHIYVDTKTGVEYFGTNIKGEMCYTVRLDQNGKPKINKKYLDKLTNPNIEEIAK